MSNTLETSYYGDDPDQFVNVYRPTGLPCGTIISLHGGYWRARFGLERHDRLCAHLANQGWIVLNVEYRRVRPDGPAVWPEMSSDVLDACVLAHDFPAPHVTVGHSAGGQLALWAGAQPSASLDAVVALAPVSDLFLADGLQLSNHATKGLLGESAAERPDLYAEASPLYLLPLGVPQLIVHGQADEHVPFEMAPEYVEAGRLGGDDVTFIDLPDANHSQLIDPDDPVWRQIDPWLAGLTG